MKFTMTVKAALEAIGAVAPIAAGSTMIPILSHARLVAGDGGVELTTSDLDRQATARAEAQVETPGAICVPARLLADIVRNLPKTAELTLLVADGRARIVSGRSRFTLPTLPASDFPDFRLSGDSVGCDLDAADLARTLECVATAISTEETRYYLCGIYVQAIETGLRFVATDGHRLMRRDLACPPTATPAAILPAAVVKDICRLAGAAAKGARISLAIGAARVEIALGDVKLIARTIDGTFPDYDRVIPRGAGHWLEVEAAALAFAVARALIACGDKGRRGRLEFAGSSLLLSAANGDGADASDEIDAAGIEAPIAIGFNLGYLAEMARALAGDRLVFELSDPASPALLRDPAAPGALGVLMPIRP